MYKFCIAFLLFNYLMLTTAQGGVQKDTTSRNSLLYNGVEYTRITSYSNESPFFAGDDFYRGKLNYGGNWYQDIDLQYDCILDELVMKDPSSKQLIRLIKAKVDEFILGGHHFVKLSIDKEPPAFYELLYQGKRSLILRWKKNVERDLALVEHYTLSKNMYLLEGDKLTRITSSKDLTSLMGDKKRKMQQFYRENNLSFKTNPELAATKILQKAEAEGW